MRLLDEESIQSSASTVGFVFPVHALTIPIAVRRFLRKAKFPSAEYLSAVATRQGTMFCGFPLIDRLLAGHGKRLDAHSILNMGNNESRREGYQGPDGTRAPGHSKRRRLRNCMSSWRRQHTKKPLREQDTTCTIPVGPFTMGRVMAGMTLFGVYRGRSVLLRRLELHGVAGFAGRCVSLGI